MAYTTINKSTDHFNTVTYTGNGSTNAITGVGFQPDWVWIKRQSGTGSHRLFDSVRGVHKTLSSNSTGAELDNSYTLTSFDTDGFSLASDSGNYGVNVNGDTQVAWNWKAGGSASSNSNGSITSSVSVNTTAGFSIVSYTGTGSVATVGHGLGVVPQMYIVKNRDYAEQWDVYFEDLGATKNLSLDSNAAAATQASRWNNTAPTNQVFTVGTSESVNNSGDNLIAYCFAEIPGYSKFGSYTGNGQTGADAPFIYTGFKPSFVIYKNASAVYHWGLFDNKRSPFNVKDDILFPNLSNAQSAGDGRKIDMLSNGFKVRVSSDTNNINGSGNTIVYMAFAEAPLVGSNNVPATAV